jgi:hypothetical protein
MRIPMTVRLHLLQTMALSWALWVRLAIQRRLRTGPSTPPGLISFVVDAVAFPRTHGEFRKFEGGIAVDFDHPERSRSSFMSTRRPLKSDRPRSVPRYAARRF